MSYLEFNPYLANPDIYLSLGRHSDSAEYHEHTLLYDHNYLVINENSDSILMNDAGK